MFRRSQLQHPLQRLSYKGNGWAEQKGHGDRADDGAADSAAKASRDDAGQNGGQVKNYSYDKKGNLWNPAAYDCRRRVIGGHAHARVHVNRGYGHKEQKAYGEYRKARRERSLLNELGKADVPPKPAAKIDNVANQEHVGQSSKAYHSRSKGERENEHDSVDKDLRVSQAPAQSGGDVQIHKARRIGSPADFYQDRNKDAHQYYRGQHEGKPLCKVWNDELIEGKFHALHFNGLSPLFQYSGFFIKHAGAAVFFDKMQKCVKIAKIFCKNV